MLDVKVTKEEIIDQLVLNDVDQVVEDYKKYRDVKYLMFLLKEKYRDWTYNKLLLELEERDD